MPIQSDQSPELPQASMGRLPDAPVSESEFCRRYGFARATIRKFRREGMPHIQIGALIRIEPGRAFEWMREQAKTPRGETRGGAS